MVGEKPSKEERQTLPSRWIVVSGAFLASGLVFYLLRGALMPFALGLAIAYLLDPVADRMEGLGLPRAMATLIILLSFFGLLALAILTLVPLLGPQLVRLFDELPGYLSRVSDMLSPAINRLQGVLNGERMDGLQQAATGYADVAAGWALTVLKQVWAGGLALVDLVSLFVITPMVAFYLLRDFDKVVAKIGNLIPRPYAEMVTSIARESDGVLGRFVRGQAIVALLLGLYYASALTFAGLKFGLAIGVVAGILNIVPFVGSIIGFAVSMCVALRQRLARAPPKWMQP